MIRYYFSVPCIDTADTSMNTSDNCQLLNDFWHICKDYRTSTAAGCQWFCGFCQDGRFSKLPNMLACC